MYSIGRNESPPMRKKKGNIEAFRLKPNAN